MEPKDKENNIKKKCHASTNYYRQDKCQCSKELKCNLTLDFNC